MIPIYWSRFYKKVVSISLLIASYNVYSQDLNSLQQQYPNENEIALEVNNHYKISLNQKNELLVTNNSIEDYLILKNVGSGISTKESVIFSDLVPLTKYEAYTLASEDGKTKKIPVKIVNDKPYDAKNIFDTDAKLKIFTFSNLAQGARKVIKYETLFKDPMLLHRFYFATGVPAVTRKIQITVDNDIEIAYKIFNDADNIVEKSIDKNKKTTTYNFTTSNAPTHRLDTHSAGRSYEMPHIHFWITSYEIKGVKQPVLGTVDRLYNYYSNFLKFVNTKEDVPLKDFTLKLLQGIDNQDMKMEVIFQYVQNHIKYVAFESGYEGFIPRNASIVFERKYGDCKDMTSLIVEMAKYAEIPNVNFTWVGTRSLPYTYEELPTPAVDNHMIATYESNDKIIFLDGTDAKVPFGLPSAFIQGKEALIAQGASYKIITVPTIEAAVNKYEDTYAYTLINNTIKGEGRLNTYGLTRTHFLNWLGDEQRERKKNIASILERGNNKLNLISFEEQNLANNKLPYGITYDFENENYAINAADETYLNMILFKPMLDYLFKDDRKVTADLDKLQLFSINARFDIPLGHQVTYIPLDSTFENDYIKYAFTYERLENSINLKYHIENKKTFIRPSEINAWNESIKKLKNNYSETIVIKKS